MNKKLITNICFLLFVFGAKAQTVLDSPLSGTHNVTDRESIILKPGFSTAGHTFTAKIDPYMPQLYQIASLSWNKNFIHTITPQIAISDLTQLSGKYRKDITETVVYQDVMGRAEQMVSIESSPTYRDAVAFKVYDDYGMETTKYLPLTYKGKGQFISNIEQLQKEFYQAGHANHPQNVASSTKPWAVSQFDGSPLNKIEKQGGVGEAWQIGTDHEQTFGYTLNSVADKIIDWSVNASGSLVNDGIFAAAQLHKNVSTDENGNSVIEFKNVQGQVLVKRVDAERWLSTHYVYDDLGHLRFVLSPKVFNGSGGLVNTVDDNVLKGLCYCYKYDERGRLIEKRLPGSDWIKMVYDKRDRLAMVQDGNNKDSKWLFTKYDALDRPIITGMYTSTVTRTSLQAVMNNETILYESRNTATGHINGYTNNTYPKTGTIEYLTFTYYDDYIFPNKKAFATGGIVSTPATSVKGQVTGTRTKILGTTNDWLDATTYYDSKYRSIQTVADLYGGETTTVSTLYDFAGKVIQSKEVQVVGTATNTLDKFFTYDHAGRLRKLEQQVNGGSRVQLADNKYNELGELIQKKLGGGLQTVDYQYNIKGWLTAINKLGALGDDLFAMELKYETGISALTANAQFNGNISAMTWEGTNYTGLKTYGYSYDNANRLILAKYGEGSNYTGNKDHYNVEIPTYDANGNIINLNRYNGGDLIDDLTYTYTGNKLDKVEDGPSTLGFVNGKNVTQEYLYDANGNMTDDENKDQSVMYNYLNLVQGVTKGSGDYIDYIYDALGNKLAKKVRTGVTEDIHYRGSFVYKGSSLSYILHEEGLVDCTTGNTYQYYLKDHLGNVREVFKNNGGSAQLEQEQHYYPFGMEMGGLSYNAAAGTINNYKYNGKEYQNEIGWLDYGARMYDPSLARWSAIDPMAESYLSQSTYHFSGNNPVKFVDENGMYYENPDEWNLNTHTGELTWMSDLGGSEMQFVNFVTSVDGALSLNGQTYIEGSVIHSGPMAKNYNGDFTYGVSNKNLWADIPMEYNGHYMEWDLKSRYVYSNRKDQTQIKSIRSQEGLGLDRREMIWNSSDEYRQIVSKYGTNASFVMAHELGMMPLPTGNLDLVSYGQSSLAMGRSSLFQNTSSLRGSNLFKNIAVYATQPKYSNNPWIRFLQMNKGKYSGKSWLNNARRDYYNLK